MLKPGHVESCFCRALDLWKQAYPSQQVAKVAGKIPEYQQIGGHLADMLEPLETEFTLQLGTDPSFYPAMRFQAQQIGAVLPARVLNTVTCR